MQMPTMQLQAQWLGKNENPRPIKKTGNRIKSSRRAPPTDRKGRKGEREKTHTKTHRTSSVVGSVIYRMPIKLSEGSGGGSCCLDVLSGSDSDSRIQDGEWPE